MRLKVNKSFAIYSLWKLLTLKPPGFLLREWVPSTARDNHGINDHEAIVGWPIHGSTIEWAPSGAPSEEAHMQVYPTEAPGDVAFLAHSGEGQARLAERSAGIMGAVTPELPRATALAVIFS